MGCCSWTNRTLGVERLSVRSTGGPGEGKLSTDHVLQSWHLFLRTLVRTRGPSTTPKSFTLLRSTANFAAGIATNWRCWTPRGLSSSRFRRRIPRRNQEARSRRAQRSGRDAPAALGPLGERCVQRTPTAGLNQGTDLLRGSVSSSSRCSSSSSPRMARCSRTWSTTRSKPRPSKGAWLLGMKASQMWTVSAPTRWGVIETVRLRGYDELDQVRPRANDRR